MISTTVQFGNEIKFLPFWFEKAKKHSDEIICGLNEPTDGSLEWVENYSKISGEIPIKLLYFSKNTILNHGFSFIKNKLIEVSKGTHVISLDIDEEMEITKEEIKKIKLIASTNTYELSDGNSLLDNNFDNMKKSGSWIKLKHYRIFRNIPSIRWKGYIHEELHIKNVAAGNFQHTKLNNIMWHYTNLRSNKNKEEKNILYAKLLCRIYDNPSLREGTNEYWYTTYFKQNEKNLRQLSKLAF